MILTDSDSAGLKIRNHIKGCCKNGDIINVFVPQIKGKEKRKTVPSSEGYLGVEGLDTEILESALKKPVLRPKAIQLTKTRLSDQIRYDG